MAFYHAPTFLKSAIARNPFCHGGIITPEDVLRLESQFPILFDKPVETNVETSEKPVNEIKDEQEKQTIHVKRREDSIKKLPKPTVPSVVRKKPPEISKFHRNCLPPPPTSKSDGKKVPAFSPRKPVNPQQKPNHLTTLGGTNKLIRPAQSFYLENLRETLKEVLREDSLSIKKFQGQSPSPYTEDLVKKFLGRKLEGYKKQRNTGKIESASPCRGQGDAGFVTELTKHLKKRDEPRQDHFHQDNRNKKLFIHTSTKGKSKVQRVQSAPGFLRSSPPHATVRHKTRSSSARYISSPKKESISKKHVSWEENSDHDGQVKVQYAKLEKYKGEEIESEVVDRPRKDKENPSENRSNDFRNRIAGSSSRIRSNRTEIHIRSEKPPPQDILTNKEAKLPPHAPTLPTSSYHHLLAARAAASKYDTKGLLRKQGIPLNTYVKHKQNEQKLSSNHRGNRHSRELKKISSASTTRALEKIAKELVYMEILHQLDEIKQEATTNERVDQTKVLTSPETDNSSSPHLHESEKVDLKFSPTEAESESFEEDCSSRISAIVLKTPDLTPPEVINAKPVTQVKMAMNGSSISLHTPELSKSLKKVVATNPGHSQSKAVPQHNLADTDCSEMSDFIFSEVADIRKKNIDNGGGNVEKVESIKLITPELSKSFPLDKNANSSYRPKILSIADKDASILSEIKTISQSNSEKVNSTRNNKTLMPLGNKYDTIGKSSIQRDDSVENISNPESPSPNEDHSQSIHKKARSTREAEMPKSNVSPPQSRRRESAESTMSGVSTFSRSNFVQNPDDCKNEGTSPVKSNESSVKLEESKPGPCSPKGPVTNQISSEHNSFQDEENDLNGSRGTVADFLSEGEFVGPVQRSPGEVSYHREGYKPPTSKKDSKDLSINSTTFESNDESGSFISNKAQIFNAAPKAIISLGEYIQP